MGLYDPDTGARLPVFDDRDQHLGDSLTLATLEIN
jgi:hypothetical protein